MRRMKLILVILLLLATAIHSHAAPKNKKDAAAAKKKSDKWPQKPFNDQATTVKFLDTNSEIAIYHALEKKRFLFTKSEFEKTEDYHSRLEGLESTPLVDKLKFGDTIAVFASYDQEVSYDADSGIITAVLDQGNVHDDAIIEELSYLEKGSSYIHTYPISIRTFGNKFMEKKFTGENAFGRKVKAVARGWSVYALALKGPGKVKMEMAMAPREALEAKLWGGIIITGKLRYPYIGSHESHENATIDDPVEEYVKTQYVVIEPEEVWFVHRKSGKVYKKIEIEDLEPDEAAGEEET